jgi:hypothetical protein
MNRTVPFVVVAVASLAVLALPAMGMGPTTGGATQVDSNATTPGEQLSGVVGVQGAELDGALEQRAFGIQFSQAADNDTKAAILADRLQSVEQRLAALRDRKATLEAQRNAGEITDGKYRAKMAKVATQLKVLSRATNQTEQAAGNVPAAALEGRGVNATAIQTLRDRASELSGPEVAAIARDIAGPGAGKALGRGNETTPVNGTGPPGADSNRGDGQGKSARSDQAGDERQSPGENRRENSTRVADGRDGADDRGGDRGRDDTASDDTAGDSEQNPDDPPGNETEPGGDGTPTETESDDTQTNTPTDDGTDRQSPGNDRADDSTADDERDDEDDEGDEGDDRSSSKAQR